MRDHLSETFKEIMKDFNGIDEDEHCELLDEVINTGIYQPIMVSITDIMMCFEKHMIETNHRFVFMNDEERQEALIQTIKEHLIP
ncbi:MAG: hypothetical protein COA44_15200 [Arcobacter sp.]|nr:MAG: hypothetical protein COA44_15200 [Arcobacter sp.]